MDISLSKLPWYGQIGAFVVVCGMALYGFHTYYVKDAEAELALRRQHLATLRADINRGIATARRLPEFQAEVTTLPAGQPSSVTLPARSALCGSSIVASGPAFTTGG